MINSVTVINSRKDAYKMELSQLFNGLAIESITGIGPGKATINVTELATSDGGIYNSARLSKRNIVFSFYIVGEPNPEDSRQLLYRIFPIKERVSIEFITDNRMSTITGYVESVEPDIFQDKEKSQVSIICDDPYFYADNAEYKLNGIDDMFEFPFENDSLSDNLIEFGEIVYDVGQNLYYEGDIESGLLIHIHAAGAIKNLSITNWVTKVTMAMDTSKIKAIVGGSDDDIILSDDIYISTMKSDKYIKLVRNGVTYNILSVIPKLSDWLTIKQGNNQFFCEADIGADKAQITIQSYVLYAGV